MLENLLLALQITAAGMGLVFAAIILLWIVMAALVHLARDRRAPAEPGGSELPAPAPAPGRELMRQAAAIAVAVALARQAESQTRAFPIADPDAVTAWQAVTRARQLSQRGARR
jgi:Na+-transporting methylmalonyl-CoA/oxaloacetate decarboxylase gamma subunit